MAKPIAAPAAVPRGAAPRHSYQVGVAGAAGDRSKAVRQRHPGDAAAPVPAPAAAPDHKE